MSPRDHHAPWTRTVVTHAAQPRGQKVGREPTFSIADAGSAEARWALQQYFDELAGCFDGGFVVGDAFDEAAALYSEPTGRFLLASLEGEIVGCGAVVFLDADTAEIKRMWVSPTSRGVGLGSQLLDRLEHELRLAGRRSLSWTRTRLSSRQSRCTRRLAIARSLDTTTTRTSTTGSRSP
jgi:GNAT superfamily N-acetyltransferase